MNNAAASRINNPHSCIVCARRADGTAVGKPPSQNFNGRLGWYCSDCGPYLAKEVLLMADKPSFDVYEKRACETVAALCGMDEFTMTKAELPEFIRWAVTEFGNAIRAEIEAGSPPF